MEMIKKTFMSAALVVICTAAGAQSAYSTSGTIKNLTVGPGMVRVEITGNTNNAARFASCSTDRQWYYLDISPTASGAKEMLATLMLAKASGQSVFVQVSGCIGDYSKIVHVYVCDSSPTCS